MYGPDGVRRSEPKLVTAERAREIVDAGGSVHRDERYSGDYRYIVDEMGALGPDPGVTCSRGAFLAAGVTERNPDDSR